MPALIKSDTRPKLVPWTEHPVTTESLDWAPLVIVDLAKFDTPHGKQELANELKDAVRRWGFWTVVGTGISQDQLDRQLDIGNTFFKLPLAEKQKVSCNFQEGKYVLLCIYSEFGHGIHFSFH